MEMIDMFVETFVMAFVLGGILGAVIALHLVNPKKEAVPTETKSEH